MTKEIQTFYFFDEKNSLLCVIVGDNIDVYEKEGYTVVTYGEDVKGIIRNNRWSLVTTEEYCIATKEKEDV